MSSTNTVDTANTANTVSTASTTGGTATCPNPRTPAEDTVPNGNSGSFDTTDAVCYRVDHVPGNFAGWGCSNFMASGGGDRTVKVNGTTLPCGEVPLPDPIDGSYYFEIGAGTNVSAGFYWFNWE